jgi:hypothetical protein
MSCGCATSTPASTLPSVLLDTIDLMGVPLHATCLGELAGAAVAILADQRTAGPLMSRTTGVDCISSRSASPGHAVAPSMPWPPTCVRAGS